MRLVVTGADRPAGNLLCRALAETHSVRPVGHTEGPAEDLPDACEPYVRIDLRVPSSTRLALRDADAIIHAQPHDPGSFEPDGEVLDVVSRGTYVLLTTAHQMRIGRVVLVSQLEMMADYPEDFAVDEHWLPRPTATAEGLAPFTAELVAREIARIGKIECVALRAGELGPDGTTAADLTAAVERGLHREMAPGGYQWFVEHVASAGRFAGRR